MITSGTRPEHHGFVVRDLLPIESIAALPFLEECLPMLAQVVMGLPKREMQRGPVDHGLALGQLSQRCEPQLLRGVRELAQIQQVARILQRQSNGVFERDTGFPPGARAGSPDRGCHTHQQVSDRSGLPTGIDSIFKLAPLDQHLYTVAVMTRFPGASCSPSAIFSARSARAFFPRRKCLGTLAII